MSGHQVQIIEKCPLDLAARHSLLTLARAIGLAVPQHPRKVWFQVSNKIWRSICLSYPRKCFPFQILYFLTITVLLSHVTGLTGCHKRSIYWHVIGMGTTPEVHSIFLEGHTFLVRNHRQASLEISPITFLTAQTFLMDLGQFLLFCHIPSHQHGNICWS